MAKFDNETLVQFGKAVGFGLACFAAIITTVGVWNAIAVGAIEGFYGWVAGANLVVEGFGFYSLYRKLFPKKVKKTE